MKKLLILLLIASLCLGFVGCSGNYAPVPSTDEELKTVFTLKHKGETYEVKYELYRALFVALKPSVDLGDDSVWSGENKDEYIEKINEKIIDYASEIYSTFSLCKAAGIDVYSPSFEDDIDEYVKASVEGGIVNGLKFLGYEGNYEKYLAALKKDGVNDSVQRLAFRYSLAVDAISEYYMGDNIKTGNVFGEIEYTEDDIRRFYYSENCVRVIYAFLSSDAYTLKRANEVRDVIATKTNADAVAIYIAGHTTALSASDVKLGLLMGKYSMDERYFGEIINSAFSLSLGETSEVFELNTGSENGYVIMYKIAKNDEYLSEKYEEAVKTYLENELGKILNAAKLTFIESAKASDYLKDINHATLDE